MIKKIEQIIFVVLVLLTTLLWSRDLQSLEVKPGVYSKTSDELKNSESKFGLKMWTWLGFVPGNDETDPLHIIKKRSTFIAHHENEASDVHYVIIWGHGMNGFTGFSNNMFPQLKHLIETGKSFTLIEPELPWSTNVSRIDGRSVWKQPGSFLKFVESARNIAPKVHSSKKIRYVIGGHSRGGKFIYGAAKSGDLCKLNPYWIIWSDATYGDWFDKAWSSCLKDSAAKVEIFFLKNTQTQASVLRVLKNSQTKNIMSKPLTSPWYHGKVGNNAIIMSEAFK